MSTTNPIDGVQDYAASITWSHDWSAHLTAAGRTITAATVTCPNAAATITSVSNTTTAVTFRLATTGLTVPTILTLTTHVTLDNADVDERDLHIQVTNT